MWRVLLLVTALVANCESHAQGHKFFSGRNKRIIKVQGPPHFNQFHGHYKPLRTRPFGFHYKDRDEFVRPNHPPPIPPFFSPNHVKHLPRPPPHVFHKLPSYGLGFPYKSFGSFPSFRPSNPKDHFRVHGLPAIRPASIPPPVASSSAATTTAFHSPTFTGSSFLSAPVAHIISSDDNNGPIREIPAPDLAPKPHEQSFASVAPLQPEPLFDSFGKEPGVTVDIREIVKESAVNANANGYIKDTSENLVFGKAPTVEIANFDEGSSLDVTNLIKEAAAMPDHNSGYQVTEHHNHLPSNDQIIKGHDGSKLYYAPDPDPSLPVYKVPPTHDPHSTPSNGHAINNVYLPQIPGAFPYLQGEISSRELFHFMHGYPTVISQPVVAFVGQPQTQSVILQGGGGDYSQQASDGHYTQQYGGNDIGQYLQQPEIHNLLHEGDESHQEQETSHSSVVSQNYPQSVYSPQYQTGYKTTEPDSDTGVDHNYQYEPEASESNVRSSLTVIRHTDEGSFNSEAVKELLLEDSAGNDLSKDSASQNLPTVLHLKNAPEVPFYASLPNRQAAEALATLQAAGSVASNYMNRVKITRGDQGPEEEEGRSSGGASITKGKTIKLGSEKTVVEIHRSLPVYETRVSSKNLIAPESESPEEEAVDDLSNLDFKEDESNETFGKRLRPK